MKLSLIVAMTEDNVIGFENNLPWRLPNDLAHVKKMTQGHTLIMGRKNYESIGRPLPNRRNIILTRNKNYVAEGCEIATSMEEVFELIASDEKVFIFGGEEIYRMFLPYVGTMYVTRIYHKFKGDTFFPEIDWTQWVQLGEEKKQIVDEKNIYMHSFFTYLRKW